MYHQKKKTSDYAEVSVCLEDLYVHQVPTCKSRVTKRASLIATCGQFLSVEDVNRLVI